MDGYDAPSQSVRLAHSGPGCRVGPSAPLVRERREAEEEAQLAVGATRSRGAGSRIRDEEADPLRTCFERDRDRILHSTAFRRLAGKTQVFIYPADHQRTRLTHALEVGQVAVSVARAVGLNVALTEAIALGHDCGHGPGGHASEDAFSPYLPGGFEHSVFGADVALASLNLCRETLDGIRNHSWSRPAPSTPEGTLVSWADRCAYSAHDLEDAVRARIVDPADLPRAVTETVGATRSSQLSGFITALVSCITEEGIVGMDKGVASGLAALRQFNYERIYLREESVAESRAMVAVLSSLVEFYATNPESIPAGGRCAEEPASAAVSYVAGMTDRYALRAAVQLLGWEEDRLPRGVTDAFVGGARRPLNLDVAVAP